MTTMPRRLSLSNIAESYVKLALSVGHFDKDYVDAFYGPERLKEEAERERLSLEDIRDRTGRLREELLQQRPPGDEMTGLRIAYLRKQLESMQARVSMLQGTRLTFDEESSVLYDAVAPTFPESHFRALVDGLSDLLPGTGPVPARYEAFRKSFVIAPAGLHDVFGAAIAEGRSRTRQHFALPAEETFTVEYVTGKSWSGYNWYRGNAASVIQVNTDFPITIDRAVDLACHEGYPGHHVYNSLLEEHLVRKRKWVEYSVYALYSPQSLIAEGTANFGISMALPGKERVEFERRKLFPLAGLDPARADEYYAAYDLSLKLAYAGNEAARGYLDGSMTRDQAASWLIEYALMSPERAMQRTHFFDDYRSYVINYNLGQDLIQQYVEGKGGTPDHPGKRWEIFKDILTKPWTPSGLR